MEAHLVSEGSERTWQRCCYGFCDLSHSMMEAQLVRQCKHPTLLIQCCCHSACHIWWCILLQLQHSSMTWWHQRQADDPWAFWLIFSLVFSLSGLLFLSPSLFKPVLGHPLGNFAHCPNPQDSQTHLKWTSFYPSIPSHKIPEENHTEEPLFVQPSAYLPATRFIMILSPFNPCCGMENHTHTHTKLINWNALLPG